MKSKWWLPTAHAWRPTARAWSAAACTPPGEWTVNQQVAGLGGFVVSSRRDGRCGGYGLILEAAVGDKESGGGGGGVTL